MRRVFSALLSATFVLAAGQVPAAGIADIGKVLTPAPMVCGAFTQSKWLKALARPLVSRGRVVFVSGTGVLWQITSPFPSRLLFKTEAVIRWDENDVPKPTGFGQFPQFRALSDVFFAVFDGDTSRLATAFDASATVGPDTWTLTLKPRDKGFAARISDIDVSGGRYVEELTITEGQGDRTAIRFSGLTADGCVLSTAEKGYLAY